MSCSPILDLLSPLYPVVLGESFKQTNKQTNKRTYTFITHICTLIPYSRPYICVCRSLFGGQPLTIGGTGFGTDVESVGVSIGGRPCSVNAVEDTSITCLTPSASHTHHVNNSA